MTLQRLTFRVDLQGLRAIAVLLVILTHTGLNIVPGGFIGVDLFFVLSGYLITALLLRELKQNGRIAFTEFYARRLKRLLPALLLMLGVSSAAAIWLLSGVEARIQLASAPFALTWTSNLYFSFASLNYFDELASRDLFLHSWSLGVEEQFYLLWPILLLMLFRSGNWLTATKAAASRLMFGGFGIAFIASLALSIYWTTQLPQAAFYLMPSRIWQFSLGAMVCLTFRDDASNRLALSLNKIPAYLLLGIGLSLISGSAMALDSRLAYPGFWALIPSLGAALVIIAGHVLPKGRYNPLAHPLLVWLGDRSYSWYLWHWPIFILGFAMGWQGQLLPTLCLILLSLLAAMLSFRLIELPLWKGRLSHARPRHTLLASLLIMAAITLAMQQGLRQLPQPDTATDLSNQWRSDLPIIYQMPCDAWYAHAQVEPCTFGTQAAQKTVVLLGDSVGAQWFSMIPELFPAPHWRTLVLTKSSCAMVDEDYYYQRIGKTYQVCTDWRHAVLDELDRLKPDVLIMGNAATYEFSQTQWVEGSARILQRVSQAANRVFVIPGTPSLGFDGPGCISRHLLEGRIDQDSCTAKNRLQQIEPVTRFLDLAAQRFPNVQLLDLNDLVCPDATCNAVSKDGQVIFRDSQHLTDSFVRAQIPLVRERLKRLGQD